ncbi:hypothetical protein EBZ80_02910 [bacterium]|nr:hypothetical protein [bacterium]
MNRKIFQTSPVNWGNVAVAVVSAVLLTRLKWSFWIDETGMIAEIKQPFASMVRDYTEVFPMLSVYEVMMWAWGRIFGYSEVSMRLPSVIFGGIAVYNLNRSVQRLSPRINIAIPSLVLLSMEPVTGFIVSARPYAMGLAALSLCLRYWVNYTFDGSPGSWWNFCVWGAVSSCIKVFAVETPLTLIGVSMLHNPGPWEGRWARLMAGLTIIIAPLLAQAPVVMHFMNRSSIHSYRGQLPATQLLDFLVYSLVPPVVIVLMATGLTLASLRGSKPISTGNTGSVQTAATGVLALCVPLAHFVLYKATGAFVVHSNYIIAAYMPAAFCSSACIARWVRPARWRHLAGLLLVITATFNIVTKVEPENWRRGINLANATYRSRNDVVLLQAGFYENAFAELLDYPLLSGPGIAYPVLGNVAAIPSNLSEPSRKYLEKIINRHKIDRSRLPLIIVARSPSALVAQYLADRLKRRLSSLEQDGIIVFELY